VTVDVPDFMGEAQQFLNVYLGVTTQIAALIATGNPAGNPGGVPLLVLNNLLDRQINKTILHGGNYTSPGLTINQPSYDFVLSLTYPAGTTRPWLMVQFFWTDSAMGTGFLTEETWFVTGGSQGICQYSGRGLTKGDNLQVIITNLDTAQTVTYTYAITQHSRIVARDDIRATVFNSPGTSLVAAPNDLSANILAECEAVALGAGANTTFYMPLYAGRARLMVPEQAVSRVIVRAAAATFDPNFTMPTDTMFDSGQIAANAGFSAAITLPRMVCALQVFNSSGAAANIFASVVAEEY
jgi:hypothetical protein